LPDDQTVKMTDSARDALFTDVYVAPTLLYLQGLVRKAFGNTDPYHGLGHALDVEKNIFALCEQRDLQVGNVDKLVLRAAALMHDIGYAAYEPHWSNDRREHIQVGLDFVFSQLRNTPIFAEFPDLINEVVYLIAYHDSTNYQFPSLQHDGRVKPVELGIYSAQIEAFEESLTAAQRERLQTLLGILREADAMVATDTAGARRTFNYSRDRGLPLFAEGDPLRAWCWEESAVGNVRLSAKRALLDTVSDYGKRAARQQYAAAESFIERTCRMHGVDYIAETRPIPLLPPANSLDVRLMRAQTWGALVAMLRAVTLLGDETLRPYADATITPRKVHIDDLRPTAYYALKTQIEWHHQLASALQRRYALSLFDLTTAIDCEHQATPFRIAPPLVETYHEPTENKTVSAIVDGLHRVLLARQLGIDSLWVIDLRDIPPHYPLVPLPLAWGDVTLCDAVPPTHAKRKFRFPQLEDFPADEMAQHTRVSISRDNYLYFFYRDLSELGSEGVRAASTAQS
jgi:hypothetical protein